MREIDEYTDWEDLTEEEQAELSDKNPELAEKLCEGFKRSYFELMFGNCNSEDEIQEAVQDMVNRW